MKIAFIDDLLEVDVCSSLVAGMETLGADVKRFYTGWDQHKLATNVNYENIEDLLAWQPDVLFNFRVSNLNLEAMGYLRDKGVFLVAWFSDDPVLYRHLYSRVFDAYDLVLHAASEEVLRFYRFYHGISGLNFPFWANPTSYSKVDLVEGDAIRPVFLGNCIGRVKGGRAQALKNVNDIHIMGRCDTGLSSSYANSVTELDNSLNQFNLGLNISQEFSAYIGSRHYFSGLERLGEFELPSRIVQYMAKGIPVYSLKSAKLEKLIQEVRIVDDFSVLPKYVSESVINDSETLCQEFQKYYSSLSRARFLYYLLEHNYVNSNYDPSSVHKYFKQYKQCDARLGGVVTNSETNVDFKEEKEKLVEELRSREISANKHYRILHFGTGVNGSTDIVLSLRRSLEDLGHDVLHVDTRQHRSITDNPYKRQGGHGPIFIKYDAIKSILNSFNPQILICNAGGLTFTEDDAKKIKERGVLLLGITLSDPDVQPSVMEFASVFDIHTTNADLALKRYHEAGISNTVYFPFGIDKEYILQEVKEEKDYEADVICIGHAAGRPERNSLMSELNNEFKVNVYGTGWELPGATVVEGQEMIKASRGGKIHINFANTRAGYINIKCGVFETVGSGGLLCTAPFKEMEQFFEYGKEIVGYKDAKDLTAGVREIVANGRLDEMRLAAFKRLINEHLYEYRWLDLFSKIERDVFSECKLVDETRAKVLRKTLSLPANKVDRRVLVYGFYGAKNLGDELILKSICENIKKKIPNTSIVAASQNPKYTMEQHGINAILRKDLNQIHSQVVRSDHVILGGGGLWHDYTFEKAGGVAGLFNNPEISIFGFGRPLILSSIYGVPSSGFGLGVGPLTDPLAKKAIKFVATKLDNVIVRDETSKELLTGCGVNNVKVYSDTVYALDLPKAISNDKKYLTVNLRKWKALTPDRLEILANYINQSARELGVKVMLLPIQQGSAHDIAALKEFSSLLSVGFEVFDGEVTLNNIVPILASSKAVVSMRLHLCLLAHRYRLPCVGISYDNKVAEHFDEVGSKDYVYLEELEPLNEISLLERSRFPFAHEQRISECEASALKAFDVLCDSILSNPAPSDLPSIIQKVDLSAGIAKAKVKKAVSAPKFKDIDLEYSSNCEYVCSRNPSGPVFYMKSRAPKKGAFVSAKYQVTEDANMCTLIVKSPYSKAKNNKRLIYSIFVDGSCVLREDISCSPLPNAISILSEKKVNTVEVKVEAMKNCEDWDWGKAALLQIQDVDITNHNLDVSGFLVKCSSPYSEILVEA